MSARRGQVPWNKGLRFGFRRDVDAWRKENRPHVRRQLAEHRQKIKIEVLTRYSIGGVLGCACGFKDIRALSLDHVNNDGAQRRREGEPRAVHLYARLKREGYPPGYQTMCMNCQWLKRGQEEG